MRLKKILAMVSVIVLANWAAAMGQVVNLPHMINDGGGNQWMIFQGGWIRLQGPMPVYSQAGMLSVNGAMPQNNSNQAQTDAKTGEVVFDHLDANGVDVSRRIRVDKQKEFVRYIDIFKNPLPQEATVSVIMTTNFSYAVQSSQILNDPKKKDRPLAWIGQMQVPRVAVEVYGGKGSKISPQISAMQGNNVLQMTMQLVIPAGKEVAIVHLHATSATMDAATQFVTQMKDSDLLADVSPELRKIIVNVAPPQLVGEREVLRGDLFDVIELRGGDRIQGTIGETEYKLNTFYGPIDLPADHVVGLINVGHFKPTQLLVTADGEIFGGTLAKDSIAIQLSSGQTTQVPLAQIVRMGYRKRPGEAEEWTFDKPMIVLHNGERMNVSLPSDPIEVMTRYGPVKISPAAIATIAFESPESGVHLIRLTDGSKFAGLVAADHFDLQLTGTAKPQDVSFPASVVSRFQFANKADDPQSDDPILHLNNQDQLVGTLDGQLKLDTTFDTITINAPELRGLVHAADSDMDVQATLWDQTTLSGQLHDPLIKCNLRSGVSVKIPIALIDRYSNPQPQPSAMMIDRIKAVVADLSADDWKQRERAEAQLVAMGPVVAEVLKDMSSSVPPEAQQRIDSVLKQLEKKAGEQQ